MTVRVEAGRLTHVDLGKMVEVPGYAPLPLSFLSYGRHIGVRLFLSYDGSDGLSLALDPHTLVTITGKDTHDG